MQQDSTNTKVQFVLRYTKGGGSSNESLNHLKLKHRIHVNLEGEDHKTIPAQEEIRSQIMKKKSLFEAIKKSNNLEKLFLASITIKPKSGEPERAFSTTGLFVTKLRNRLNDENMLRLSCVNMINIIEKLLNLINDSLKNGAETNSSNFTMLLSSYHSKSHSFQNLKKNLVFPGIISQLPETWVLNFCPELETRMSILYQVSRQFISKVLKM